jgi:PAS domain S-box-containing protein
MKPEQAQSEGAAEGASDRSVETAPVGPSAPASRPVTTLSSRAPRQLALDRFEAALEAGGMAVWEVDLATGQVHRSEAHDRLYGYPAMQPEWTLEALQRALHPEERERVQQQLTVMLRGELPEYDQTFRVLWPDTSVRWLNSRARLVRDEHGRPVAVRGVIQDVTRLKTTELALQEALRARDEFLSIASHELRTPLTALWLHVRALGQRARRGANGDGFAAHVQTKLESAERQVRKLTALLDSLMDVSRIQRGRLVHEPTLMELGELVREVAGRFEDELRQAGVTMSLEVQGPCPVRVDRMRFEQVVTNLLSNALHYGNRTPVTVRLEQPRGRARLSVRDEGPGVALEDQERIFERFEQAGASTRRSGLGLGLYIVRQIVELHGGHVWVESVPGRGATFLVEVPLATAEAA